MRIQNVVVGMDFSETSIAGARWVANQFEPDADVTLVHVVTPPERSVFAAPVLPSIELLVSAARQCAEDRMREVAASIAPRARSQIRMGKPHEQIVEAGQEAGANLIVIGPHDERHQRSRWLGATAERIVRTSTIPVLVTIDPPARRPRTLLVAVDSNRLTDAVLAWADHFAGAFDADVKLLHVWSDSLYAYVASMSNITTTDEGAAKRDFEKNIRNAATHWLEDLTARGFHGRRASAIVGHGRPASVTLEIAAASHADLIVMGRSGGPALFGSTLRTVLHHATCSVFVVTEPLAGL